ncbi:MAG TPA: winged helix-turn-helix transcriptional regulator [Candidatus Nanoarchaeia archaeon]|nr:winged helix-turn-helix transcriptional regulator [Candidatus Nanoarchaeia archaeon]
MLQTYGLLFNMMESLGKKWVVPLLLFLLLIEETNFSKMKKHLRITSRILSRKLQLLEALGLVEKIVIDHPRKILYSLTDKGKAISNQLLHFYENLTN